MYEDRTLACPTCDHRFVRSVAISLNAETAKAQRAAILDDTFQRFECERCHSMLRADGPLFYLDFDDKLWIGVFPATWEATWWRCEQEPALAFQRNMLESCPTLVREWAPGFAIRAVFGLDGLREKLVAHEAGIDDRVLEAYKLDLLRGMGPFELSGRARPRLRRVEPPHAFFHVPRPEHDQPDRLAVVKVSLDEIARIGRAQAEWGPVLSALSEGPYVDLGRILIPRTTGTGTTMAKSSAGPL